MMKKLYVVFMIKNYKKLNFSSQNVRNYKMSYYLSHKSSSNNVKVELDLTNYATKTDLKILLMLM